MIRTLRSYQVLLITQSHRFSSRSKAAESRASTGTAVARSSRCVAANEFAFAVQRPAIPIRSTPGLARRFGTLDWYITAYPLRMRTFIKLLQVLVSEDFIYRFRGVLSSH